MFRRADGRWCGQLSLQNGKRSYVYAPTAAEARSKLQDAQRRIAEGRPVKDDSRTFRQVCHAWLDAKRGTVRPKTFTSYRDLLAKHAIPVIGGYSLSKVRVTDLEQLYRQTTVSPKTVRNLHFVVKAVFDWAVRRDWLVRNPASLIGSGGLPRIQRREVSVLSPIEAKSLIEAARGTKSEALITFALMTGARVGEITGLTWDRIDLDAGRISISRSLQFLDGQPILSEPKTRAAVRDITVASPVVTALRAHRLTQNQSAMALGKAWANSLDLVFTTEIGHPLNRHAVLRQYFRPMLKRAGLNESLRFHDLRHGAASLLLSQGVPIPVVSKMLGHANPAITMSIYSHALPDSERLAAKAMESVFAGE